MFIYTLLLILVFAYMGARAEMKKQAAGAAGADETAAEEADGGQDGFGGGSGLDGFGGSRKGSGGGQNGSEAKLPDGQTGPVIRQEDLWALILTNAEYPIPENYSVELKTLPGTEQSVDVRIYDATVRMLSDMEAAGLHPIVCSAYRTLDKQEILFNRKVKNYVRQGYSMEDAGKEARHVLSIPGSGEHCLGLAIDLFSRSYQKLEEGFENTKEGQWLREYCQEYGFILRYDRGKEASTGINYEPWHFRYVGKEAAEYIMEKGITLEEFWEDL